jgi:peptidoglycan hydrolase-like protein with peptidoglycan-binding domain
MFRERTRCFRSLLVGLTAAALLLSLPATGLAAERENKSAQLAKAGLLARGAGYGTDAGSKAVRQLQLRLRRLGDRPGPIDGLYGPRTEAAVVRFQRGHGLAADGVVGPQTKGRLLAQRAEQRPARAPSPPTQTGQPERKSPAPDHRAESAPEPQPVRPSAGVGVGRAEPESSSGLPPLLVAIGAALVVASLLLTLRGRRRDAIEARLNLGLVGAALIAAVVLGAAIGALFATRAAPDDNDRTTADSGALLASRTVPAEPATRTSAKTRTAATVRASAATGRADAARRSRAKRTRSGAGTASTALAQVSPSAPAPAAAPEPAAPAPAAPASVDPAPAPPPATTPARVPSPPAPAAPVEGPADDGRSVGAVTYTVRPGDAPWPIARDHLAPDSSEDEVARNGRDLKELNIEDRIQSGDPDVIVSGEKLKVR